MAVWKNCRLLKKDMSLDFRINVSKLLRFFALLSDADPIFLLFLFLKSIIIDKEST